MTSLPDSKAEPLPRSGTLPLVLVVVVALLAMGRSVNSEFVNGDDDINLAHNPDFKPPSTASVGRYWSGTYAHMYMPVTYTLWAGVARFAYVPGRGALNPHVFHACNVIVHALNATLVFLLVRRLIGSGGTQTWAAAAGAAVFAAHPLQVEAVAWATGFKDMVYGAFTLTALNAYVVAAKRVTWSWKPYLLATAACCLALLSKPTAVAVPLLALAIDRFVIGRAWASVLKATAPWFLLAVPIIVLTKVIQPAPQVTPPAVWMRPLVAADALAFYMRNVLLPTKLAFDYGRTPTKVIESGEAYFTWLAPALAAVVLWGLSRGRASRPLLGGGVLMVAAALPLLGLVPFDQQKFSTVTDRYFYLSMSGVAIIVAGVLSRVPLRRWAGPVLVLVLVMTGASMAQTGYWRDSMAVGQRALAVNPDSEIGCNFVAGAYLDIGSPTQALPVAKRAVELNDKDHRAHWLLGAAFWAVGITSDAEVHFRRSIELDPTTSLSVTPLAALLAQQGRLEEAEHLARRAVELDPGDSLSHTTLGMTLLQLGRREEAAKELAVAARSSRDPQVHANLGILLAQLGRPEEARAHLRNAIALDPSNVTAREELERLDALLGGGGSPTR
jgi:Flp pilus assembly protein TadD